MNSVRNYSDVILEYYIVWLRDLDTEKIGAGVFGELRNVVLEENEEDEMAMKRN